jgi:hypothetical protein
LITPETLAKILREDTPEKLAAVKQSMSPEILLDTVGNYKPESETPRLLKYILEQTGRIDIAPDVWRTAGSNPTYRKEPDIIVTEFIATQPQNMIQDSSQENDVDMLEGSEKLPAEFLLRDLADSDAGSWGEESDYGDVLRARCKECYDWLE